MNDDSARAAGDYDTMADAYDTANPYNDLYERPAILHLAGDVDGATVVDAGCAAGALTAALVDRGARVRAFDVSPAMVELAERRLGDKADVRVADLARPLDFVDDESVDLVIASLVLHYLQDWVPTLKEFRRILRPGGKLVFSTHHPAMDWLQFERPNYFATELLTDVWTKGGRSFEVRFYRRPLSAIFAALGEAGLGIDEIVEPMPLPELATQNPEAYQRLTTRPWFLCVRATRDRLTRTG
ncbi:MAG TPA: methyltransferase domain-containing protein [Actinopolymorphaceae bacterium]